MNFKDNATLNLFLDLARVRDVLSNLTPIGERLAVLADTPNACNERSRLLGDLCDLYEGIVPSSHQGSRGEAISPATPRDALSANLCASIDTLLDQLVIADFKNRLWWVKARLAFGQICDLANIESRRLQLAVVSSERQPSVLERSFEGFSDPNWERRLAA